MSSATPFSKRARRAGREVPLTPLPQGRPPRRAPVWGWRRSSPPSFRPGTGEILLLYYEEGLSYQEMADRLGIPLSTCGTWLARAKAHCKTYLTQGATMPNRRNGHVPPIRRPVSGVGDHVVSEDVSLTASRPCWTSGRGRTLPRPFDSQAGGGPSGGRTPPSSPPSGGLGLPGWPGPLPPWRWP